jgi:hypothetical protein
MKKLILAGVLTVIALTAAREAHAQVDVNINIGRQPVWGPVGYDYVEYYYLPDIDAYYYVPRRQFVYLNGGSWVFASALPSRYSGYDLYSGYKVVVNEPRAYLHYKEHKVKYAPYRGNHTQVVIKNSNESKYYVVKGHPKHQGNGGHKGGKGKRH